MSPTRTAVLLLLLDRWRGADRRLERKLTEKTGQVSTR